MLALSVDMGCVGFCLGLLEGDTYGVLTVPIDLHLLALVDPQTMSLQDLHNGCVGEYCLVVGLNQCLYLS